MPARGRRRRARSGKTLFKKVAIIKPEEAARVIMKGILGNKKRVLIGADAYRIDWIARLFPGGASAMFAGWLVKRAASSSLACCKGPSSISNAHVNSRSVNKEGQGFLSGRVNLRPAIFDNSVLLHDIIPRHFPKSHL